MAVVKIKALFPNDIKIVWDFYLLLDVGFLSNSIYKNDYCNAFCKSEIYCLCCFCKNNFTNGFINSFFAVIFSIK